MERREITRWVQKILKPRKQDLDEGVGVVGLDLGLLDFFLELLEGLEVGAFALEQELQDLLDALGLELLVDAVKVIRLILPERDLSQRVWVIPLLERLLWL